MWGSVSSLIDPDAVLSVIRVADVGGVFFNAILGGGIARARAFDAVGFLALAILTGLGGGIIRDVLLGAGPVVAFTDPAYITAAVIGAAVAFLIPVRQSLWDAIFPVIDALALGIWAASGSQKALAFGLDPVPAVLLGVITAVGGGAARDVVLGKVPAVFGGNTLYATSAAVAATVMVIATNAGLSVWATVISCVVGTTLTLVATWRGWRLPQALTYSSRPRLKQRPSRTWGRFRKPRR